MRAIEESIRGIAGIVAVPFLRRDHGMMVGANAAGLSLGRQVTDTFIAWSSAESSRCWPFSAPGWSTSSCPPAAASGRCRADHAAGRRGAGVAPEVTAMAIAWGDAWTNMIQPFWALPLLGIAGLGARDIMGYCLLCLVFSGVVIAGGLYFLT